MKLRCGRAEVENQTIVKVGCDHQSTSSTCYVHSSILSTIHRYPDGPLPIFIRKLKFMDDGNCGELVPSQQPGQP